MNQDVLDSMNGVQDFGELTQAILTVCERYGQVHSLQLTHNKRAGRVSCLIELDSPKMQPALKRALGATGLEDSVYLEIPVRDDFACADAMHAPVHPGRMQATRLPGDAHHSP